MKLRFSLRPGNTDAVFRKLEERASALIAETGKGLYRLAADATPVRSGRARCRVLVRARRGLKTRFKPRTLRLFRCAFGGV